MDLIPWFGSQPLHHTGVSTSQGHCDDKMGWAPCVAWGQWEVKGKAAVPFGSTDVTLEEESNDWLLGQETTVYGMLFCLCQTFQNERLMSFYFKTFQDNVTCQKSLK